MKRSRRLLVLAAAVALPLTAQIACARPSAEQQQAAGQEGSTPAAAELLPNGRQPLPGLLTGGQPSEQQLAKLAELGYGTIVSLRTEGESGSAGESDQVRRLGMRFVSIPVAGKAGLTRENVQRLADAMREAQGPTVIHCASGNRVGALLALKDYWIDGASADESLQLGLQAGLTGLEPAVKAQLGLEH